MVLGVSLSKHFRVNGCNKGMDDLGFPCSFKGILVISGQQMNM